MCMRLTAPLYGWIPTERRTSDWHRTRLRQPESPLRLSISKSPLRKACGLQRRFLRVNTVPQKNPNRLPQRGLKNLCRGGCISIRKKRSVYFAPARNRWPRCLRLGWFCATCSAALAASFPCGELAPNSVAAVLDALISNQGAVGGEIEKQRTTSLQSMNAIPVAFACPDSLQRIVAAGDKLLVHRWIAELPSVTGRASLSPFLQHIGSREFRFPSGTSDAAITRRIQAEMEARVEKGGHASARKICGTAADTVIQGLAEAIKDGTGSSPFVAERQLTVLLGICPEESIALLQRDRELARQWVALLKPAMFDVLAENKASAEQLRADLIRHLSALKVPADLVEMLGRLRDAVQETNVELIQ